jgi:hypothetical protein
VVAHLERVDDQHRDVGATQGLLAADRHPALEVLGGLAADAGGVDEDERTAPELEADVDRVARGARLVGDDDPLLAEQRVDDARLAHVGPAHDGDADGALVGGRRRPRDRAAAPPRGRRAAPRCRGRARRWSGRSRRSRGRRPRTSVPAPRAAGRRAWWRPATPASPSNAARRPPRGRPRGRRRGRRRRTAPGRRPARACSTFALMSRSQRSPDQRPPVSSSVISRPESRVTMPSLTSRVMPGRSSTSASRRRRRRLNRLDFPTFGRPTSATLAKTVSLPDARAVRPGRAGHARPAGRLDVGQAHGALPAGDHETVGVDGEDRARGARCRTRASCRGPSGRAPPSSVATRHQLPGQPATPRWRSRTRRAASASGCGRRPAVSRGASVARARPAARRRQPRRPRAGRGPRSAPARPRSASDLEQRRRRRRRGGSSDARTRRTGPVSRPASVCMMLTPVSASPAISACCTGAAPRQRGSRLAWTFRKPSRGTASSDAGRI